jgi:hypothetical protein
LTRTLTSKTNVIVIDDWTDSHDDKKQRLLNVALSTLTRVYPTYTIPDNAVYEFSAVLATAYNDTNAQKQTESSNFPYQVFRIHLAKSKRLRR